MKSYKEIAEMLENHITTEMKNPKEALAKDIAYAMEIWNTSIIRADEEGNSFSNHEKLNFYTKMLEYAEKLFEPALKTPNQYGAYRGMYVYHIYSTMKENLRELQSVEKEEQGDIGKEV